MVTKDYFALGQQIKHFLRKMEEYAQIASYCTVSNFLSVQLFLTYIVLVLSAMNCRDFQKLSFC